MAEEKGNWGGSFILRRVDGGRPRCMLWRDVSSSSEVERVLNCVAGAATDVCDDEDDNSHVGTNDNNRGVLDSYRQYNWIS